MQFRPVLKVGRTSWKSRAGFNCIDSKQDIQLIGGSSGGVGGPSYPGMQGSAANTGYPQQWGYTPQSWDQQQQQQQQAQVQINPSTGQPDYSQQWIEYYRSMGLHREADIIEQQQKAKQQAVQAQQTLVAGSGAPNGAPVQAQTGIATVQTQQMQQAAGGQPDYSAQWAEYYRSIGKIEEAEAIENQIKASKVSELLLFTLIYFYFSLPQKKS